MPPPPSSKLLPVHAVLEALLTAHKEGRVQELLAQRPRTTRALARRWLGPVRDTAGPAWAPEQADAQALNLLLRWGLTQLRPDRGASLEGIDAAAWLTRVSWRPLLALLCHHGFAAVPAFAERYRPRPGEAVADTLCALWSVGPSSFYRYLDKGKRQLAGVLALPPRAARAASLRQFVWQAVAPGLGLADNAQRRAWHVEQAHQQALLGHPVSALWQALASGDADACLTHLSRSAVALANDPETDGLCASLAQRPLTPRQRFDLCLAQAALWRVRQASERENQALEQALHVANAQPSALLLGLAYAALGKFHEPRDADRAFACYEDSAEFLRRAESAHQSAPDGTDPAPGATDIAVEYTGTLVRLAWLYVLRNDPRSRTVLDRAQERRATRELPPELQAMLEQTWGEYWRRAGELRRALEHKHRALNLYERLQDRRSVLITYLNLSPIYGQLNDFERATEYALRVIRVSQTMSLEPEMLSSVHLNLGATYFWQGHYNPAIEQYQIALVHARQAGLALHTWRAHFNLAEAYYKRYSASQSLADEQQGDAHAAAALASGTGAEHSHATRTLKASVLGSDAAANPDRLLPQEFAEHFDEMTEVQRQRAVLAVPVEPQAHVRARLAMARAYLAMCVKEREAALALIAKHALSEPFTTEFEALNSTFQRELTRQQRVAQHWKQAARDLLNDGRRQAVLQALLDDGTISKRGYAQVAGVALATASKHLGELAGRGLLLQSGKGPSTRYALTAQ